MVKQIILIILLSGAAIFFKTQLSHMLDGLIYIHNFIAISLHMIFSDDAVGRLIQDMISLLLIPFIGGLLMVVVFWMFKREAMPHTLSLVWIVWLILVITMIAQTDMNPVGGGEGVPTRTAQQAQPVEQTN